MTKAYNKNEIATSDVDELLSMSLVLSFDHTLDFTVANDHWGKIYHALQVVVEYYQIILPGIDDDGSTQ